MSAKNWYTKKPAMGPGPFGVRADDATPAREKPGDPGNPAD
jgi:hypothetical protein